MNIPSNNKLNVKNQNNIQLSSLCSGPGLNADPIYAIYINTLMYDGIIVLGNVLTGKTTVLKTTVKNYTSLYYKYYSVNGTFFDQVLLLTIIIFDRVLLN